MASTARFDVVAIGNAIVDVLARADDALIESENLVKGSMRLIDADEATRLYAAMGPAVEMSGGSAANTLAGMAALGRNCGFIGQVAKDQLGQVFTHDLTSLGVAFDTPAQDGGAPTARCLILVTPDGQRTMNTFLGACVELSPDDIDEETIKSAAVTYMEGYLFDPPLAMEAFYKAAKIAHNAGRKVSLTLSDSFCVGRHRAAFQALVEGHVDILFANEDEIKSLYETDTFEEALAIVRNKCEISALTRSEKGSVIVRGDAVTEVKAEPVAKVLDTTGAGDVYAAGFLYGYTEGMSMAQCGQLGSIAAAEVISHIGPRPHVSLKDLIPRRAA